MNQFNRARVIDAIDAKIDKLKLAYENKLRPLFIARDKILALPHCTHNNRYGSSAFDGKTCLYCNMENE